MSENKGSREMFRAKQDQARQHFMLLYNDGLSAAGVMDISLLWVFYNVWQKSLRQADQVSRGVQPSVVCLNVIVNPRQ